MFEWLRGEKFQRRFKAMEGGMLPEDVSKLWWSLSMLGISSPSFSKRLKLQPALSMG